MTVTRAITHELRQAIRPYGGWLALALVMTAGAVVYPRDAVETAKFVAENLLYMLPIILFAIGLSGFIRASGADTILAGVFKGREATMIAAAALVGALTPICGIGVLPIIAGLLGAGVPLAPIMAFWLASPVTDPAMLMITAGTLGLGFALGKTVIAFSIGLFGGFATAAVLRHGGFRAPLKTTGSMAGGDDCDAGRDAQFVWWPLVRTRERLPIFKDEARTSGLLMIKWLTLAFVAESLLRDYLAPEIIAEYVGAGSRWAIPIAVAIGTPIYVDGYAALPLVRGLMDLGMTPGAAMAFLVSGGITSAYASVAVFALVRLPVFIWYLALAVAGSLIAGYGFDWIAVL